MTSKERVKKAIHFEAPDHIPHYLPDGKENDILWIMPDLESIEQPWYEAGANIWERSDIWGTTWRRFGPVGMGETELRPLNEWKMFKDYKFPDINRTELFEKSVQKMRENPDKYFLGEMPYISLFEGAHNLRGLDNLMVDLYEEPERVNELLDRLTEGQMESVDLLSGLGFDGVMGYDDWGMQDRLLIGMNLWNEFFKPRYKKVWDYAHSKGLDVWLHSCGYIPPVLKAEIEIGLDVIQMDQQEHIGLEVLDREFGGKIAFWCPVDIQKTMIFGEIADIRNYARRMIYHLGRFSGGLISMYYQSPEAIGHSKEKLAAMSEAFREYGNYPIADFRINI